MRDAALTIASAAAAVAVTAATGAYVWSYLVVQKQPQRPCEGAIKVGILGTGWGLKVQVPNFRAAGLDVTAIYSRDPDRAAELAAQNGIKHGLSSAAALANSSDVDLVSIVTPPYLHSIHFKEAMCAGKHVLVDKPMALNAREAEEMAALAASRPEQVAIVDHELRCTPFVRRARELVQGGAIGTVLWASCEIRMSRTAKEWSWWQDASSGGGVLGAVGSHVIDALRYLFAAEVGSVSACLATATLRLPDSGGGPLRTVTADDYCSASMVLQPGSAAREGAWWGDDAEHPASIQAHMFLTAAGSSARAPARPSIVVAGTAGCIELDHTQAVLRHYGADGQLVERSGGGGSAFAVVGTRALAAALQAALGPGRDAGALQEAATIRDGLAVQYVMDAMRQSAAGGGKGVKPRLVG